MSGHYPPLDHGCVAKILTHLGFSPRPQKGTSHQQWVKAGPQFAKVTLDKPKSPYTRDLIASIARQARISKRKLYELAREIC